jgi:hypothetical protein
LLPLFFDRLSLSLCWEYEKGIEYILTDKRIIIIMKI